MTHTIPSFVHLLGRMSAHMAGFEMEALDAASRIVQREAQRVLGTYDYGWPKLAASTVERKGGRDTPGIDTGEMQASIQRTVLAHEAHVGTNLQKAVWFELGTSSQPPRSFLAQAAIRKEKEIVHAIGGRVHAKLISP